MNILIDSGNSKNIGDNAIVSNVLNILLKQTDWNFFVIDKGLPLSINEKTDRIKMVDKVDSLLAMPRGRIGCYANQKTIPCQITKVMYWFITIARALKIALAIEFPRKAKGGGDRSEGLYYWIELLQHVDAYWAVGGGNINDIWIEQAFWKMAFAWFFKLQGKPVIFSGQGIGPINKLTSKLIVRFGIKQISLLALKHKRSLELLRSLGLDCKNCSVVGDDALAIPLVNDRVASAVPQKFIALNFSSNYYSNYSKVILEKYIKMIGFLLRDHPDIQAVFVPISYNNSGSDVVTASGIIERLPEYKNRITICEDARIENIKNILKGASLSVGVSCRFCLFSLSMGVPTVALYASEYDKQELEGLMEMFDVPNSVFDLDRIAADELYSNIKLSFNSGTYQECRKKAATMENNWNDFVKKALNKIEYGLSEEAIFLNDPPIKDPLVSVAILTKNGGNKFRQLVKKLFLQNTSFAYEVLVVDSGSTDGTVEFLRDYPVRIIKISPRDFAFGPTRDFAFSQSCGEYIVTLSQDAIPTDREWLQNIINPLVNNEADISQGISGPPEDGNVFYWEWVGLFYFTSENVEFSRRNGGTHLSCINLAIKKTVWQQTKFGPVAMCEDKQMQKKAFQEGFRVIVQESAAVSHGHTHTLRSLIKRCENEGFGWRQVGVKYRFSSMVRDYKQKQWVYERFIQGILGLHRRHGFPNRINNLAELLFLLIRPIFVYKGNLLNRSYKF